MIIRFTEHVSDGKNANLEEVQSLGFFGSQFPLHTSFHVVPLQRPGEACLGNKGVERVQIAFLKGQTLLDH